MDALGRLDGVRAVKVELQTNVVVISPERDRELDLAAVPRAIRGAGFVPAEMRLRARGRLVVGQGGGQVFRIRGWREALPVRGTSSAGIGEEVELRARVDWDGGTLVLVPLP